MLEILPGLQSRFLGTNCLECEWFCRNNGTDCSKPPALEGSTTARTDSRSLMPLRERESFLRFEPGPLLDGTTHARLCTEHGGHLTRYSNVFFLTIAVYRVY